PIDLEFRLHFDGDVTFKSALQPTMYDFQSPVISTNVDANGVRELTYELKRSQGINAKQNKTVLEPLNSGKE
ncbi:MAG TPA: hypothetical protein VG711_05450, partial [Phycisphaerales bacterium]|nr:hypothetical protein [Phycisphaerales bacterium]